MRDKRQKGSIQTSEPERSGSDDSTDTSYAEEFAKQLKERNKKDGQE